MLEYADSVLPNTQKRVLFYLRNKSHISTMKFLLRNKLLLLSAISKSYKTSHQQKKFDDIPTLPSLPILGHSYLFLPGTGYKTERLTEVVRHLSEKLGPIFRLKLGGTDIVITTDADYTETLCRNDGRYPIRPSFPALLHYRAKTYGSVGVVPGNGEEWYKYRQGVVSLLKMNVVEKYREKHEGVADNFVDYIRRNRNDEWVLEDVYQHLLKLTIEAISVVSPGYHFNCLSGELKEIDEIIKASIDFMDGLYMTLIAPPIWKYYKTSGYRKLEASHETIHSILEKYLEELAQTNSTESDFLRNTNPYMYSVLTNETFTWNDKLMLTIEVFLGGIDATATTLAVTLYFLARNRAVQELARRESIEGVVRFPYLKACIQESLRICQTAGAISRITTTQMNLGGYVIPENTLVSAFTSVTSNKPDYFNEPEVYNPERWLRTSKPLNHHFASLPFGWGPRMCPGRRIAEQEMIVVLRQILKNFKLEPSSVNEEALGMVFRMNRVPDRKIDLKFINFIR